MGCDIHGGVEIYHHKEKRWRYLQEIVWQRHYGIFAILANVRNYDKIPYISEPKGIPKDVTSYLSLRIEEWEGDGHSHSWLTWKELKDYNWQKYKEYVPFVWEHFLVFLESMSKELGQENVRIVFFFDN